MNNTTDNKRKWLLRAVGVVLLIVGVGIAGFIVYFSNPLPASADALAAMQSGNGITVTDKSDQIVFMPDGAPKAGFIFYPGARVAPAAYAVKMKAIAQKGYAVFILKVPLNMALLNVNQAAGVIAANPAIKVWAAGGHSLGGVAAASFAAGRTDVKGLILYASYPATSMASRSDLLITSISGINDGLATVDKIASNKALLPANTHYVPIDGSIHAYFGDYGPQDGDGTATISRDDATARIVAATVEALDEIAATAP
jgi:hypothetical protein